MDTFLDMLKQGGRFVRSNPQLVYTLFLVVAIPVAFFFTSEQFLQIAQENQDRLERSRIALLQEAFLEFLPEHLDGTYLGERIAHLATANETVNVFRIIIASTSPETERNSDGMYTILASLAKDEAGSPYEADPTTAILMKLARADLAEAFAMSYWEGDTRFWKSVHAFRVRTPGGTMEEGYLITDISMAQADAVARKSIRDAYVVLVVILLLIIVLLARQARIIDYAALYARLKEVDQMKDDFVSMAAHELRTPLAIIRGYIEMLSDPKVKEDEKKNEFLKRIDQAAVQLNALVGDILDVARLQEGRMSFTYVSVDASEDIGGVVEALRRPAEDKGLALFYERVLLPPIAIDRDRFRQVMINLVGNAIKYTPKGEVRVLTTATEKEVTIRVSDTGMGISAEDQQRLFQKFFRVKNSETEKITGTGLGLWITVTMVKTMKGEISVESIKGKGTDFILKFPIAR